MNESVLDTLVHFWQILCQVVSILQVTVTFLRLGTKEANGYHSWNDQRSNVIWVS